MRNCVYIFIFISSFAFGQNESFRASTLKNQLLIGEPVEVTLELSCPATISIDSIKLQPLKEGDSLRNGWEIWKVDSIKASNIESENGDYITQIIQKIEIANFDTGTCYLPEFSALVGNKNVSSNTLSYTISSVEITDNQSIKNIKDLKLDPLSILEKIIIWLKKYWFYILSCLLVIIAGIILYKKFTKKSPLSDTPQEPTIPIADILLEKLYKIEQEKLWQNGKYKQYFTKVNDVAKEFIENRYKVPTFEKTSNEIIDSLQLSSISSEWLVKLEKLFVISDLVKFAKQLPTKNENIYAIDTIRELITTQRDDLNQIEETEK